jgi:hypothetical protein
MTATVAGIHLGVDTHANRPAANTAPDGSLYSCSTHALVYKSNLAGNSWATWATLGSTPPIATDTIWDTKGDMVAATGADAATKLVAGSNGMVPTYDSAQANGVKTAYPPGFEMDYAEQTGNISVTQTAEATGDLVITGASITYLNVPHLIEVGAHSFNPDAGAAGRNLILALWVDSTDLGRIARIDTPAASTMRTPLYARRKYTPAAGAHTFKVTAHVSAGTGVVTGGAGGAGAGLPIYIRVTVA